MIFWLGILSIILSLFLSFSKLLAGLLLSILSAIAFKVEKKRELYIFSVVISIVILIKIISNAIIPIILSIIITLIFLPPVNYLNQKYKIPRSLSSLFFILISLALILFSMYYVSNILISEFQKILQNLQNLYNILPEQIKQEIQIYVGNFHYNINHFLKLAGSTISLGFYIVIGIVLAFYLISDYESIMKLISRKFDTTNLEYILDILGKYVRAQILIAIIVGIMVFLLFSLFSLKYANIIGIIAGIFNLIPNIGFIFTIFLSLLITLAVSSNIVVDLMKLAIVFTIDQIVETAILTPKIMGQRFKIEPTLVIVAITISSALFGIWGFFIAIPSAVLIRNLFFDFQKN
ncbi:MAG: AI-2E family transporter [candidate division WOR-3 bacterium]